MIDVTPIAPPEQIIAQKLVECGLDRNGISVGWEDQLQSIEVVIRRDARASAAQFDCILVAAAKNIVTFEDQSLQSAYSGYTVEHYRPQMIAEAKAAVTKLGLIDGFPRRSEYPDLRSYVVALERHCGQRAGDALRVSGDSVTFYPSHKLEADTFFRKYEKIIAAVMYAMAVGDLQNFGFIGNEAAAETGK